MSDAAGVGVLTTDRNLRVRSWNPWLAAATGQDEPEVLGRRLEELTGGPTSAWYHDLFVQVIETGSPQVLAPAFHGFLIPCSPQEASANFDRMQQRVTVAPLRHEAEIVGLIVTIEDVTWRLDAERELAAELQRSGDMSAALANVGASDWKLRRVAVDTLRYAASRNDVEHLIHTLRRDHHDINVLSSALQVLISADIDVTAALIALITDDDPNLRMHAALALGQLRNQAAVPSLVASLQDPDANVRFHVIEALGSLGAAEAVDPLAALAESGDFFIAFAAIDALGKIDDARVAPRLCDMLPDDALRPAVVETLAALGDEDSVRPLVTLLNNGAEDALSIASALERIHARYDETYQAGAQIAQIVREHISPAGVATITAALARSSPPARSLIAVLGWAGPSSIPALVGVLGDPAVRASVDAAFLAVGVSAVEPLLDVLAAGNRDARLAAAGLLGRLGDRRAVTPLIRLLDASDAELVTTAAGSLAAFGDPQAVERLLLLFAHPRASVRQAAITAINAIRSESTERAIRCRLGDQNARVRECAIRVAGYFGFRDTAPVILAAVEDADVDVRRAAIEQLPVVHDPGACPALAAAMATDTPRNRAAAAHAAAFVDDRLTAQALLRALSDDDPWVRYFAAGSIARRRIADAADVLEQLALHDAATQVRIAAMQALGAIDALHLHGVAATLLRDGDSDLDAAAIAALSLVTDPRVDDLLEEAVRSSVVSRRVPAIQALAARRTLHSVEVLSWAARIDEPPELRRSAVEGLRRLGLTHPSEASHAAIEALLALTAERDTRDDALAAVATLPADAVEMIAPALDAKSLAVRVAAVEALGRMRHQAASAALAHALDDPEAAVRSAAIGVFGRLGTRSVGPLLAAMQAQDPDDDVRRRAAAVCARYGWEGGR